MSSIREEFEQMKKEFAQVRAAIEHFHGANTDPALQEILDGLVPSLDKAYAEVEAGFPRGLTEIENELLASQKRTEEMRQSLDELRRRLDEPPPAVPPPPEFVLSPKERRALRDEVLARLGEPTPVAVDEVAGSVAGAWDDPLASVSQVSAADMPAQTPPPSPAKPKKPAADKDKELWEGISTIED